MRRRQTPLRQEVIMDIADIMFHVPADLSAKGRADIERDIQGCDGVVSAHFSTRTCWRSPSIRR